MNKNMIILLVIVLASIVGFSVIRMQNIEDFQSQCYTNLQSSNYFYDSPSFYDTNGNKLIIYMDDNFWISKGSDTGSMRPAIGDNSHYIMVEVEKFKDLKVGDVVSINREGKKNLLHRVVEIEDDYFITKGDNNNVRDPQKWTFEDINGRVVGVLY